MYDLEDSRYVVRGGRRLAGVVTVSGAKNSALKLMAASLLADGTSVLHNVPDIEDVRTMSDVLEYLGARVRFDSGDMTIDTSAVEPHAAPYELVQKMRASFQIMGPLVARFGRGRVAMPGGCNLGPRKIDFHLRGLEQLGAVVTSDHGFVEAAAAKLVGASIVLEYPSVGATENLLMASVLAEGVTVIDNAAREPEIVDLGKFLVSMGADVQGAGTPQIIVRGVAGMQPAEHTVIGDRIEAGTFLIAGAITGGDVEVHGVTPHHLDMFLSKLRAAGDREKHHHLRLEVGGEAGMRQCRDIRRRVVLRIAPGTYLAVVVLHLNARGSEFAEEHVEVVGSDSVHLHVAAGYRTRDEERARLDAVTNDRVLGRLHARDATHDDLGRARSLHIGAHAHEELAQIR